MLCALLEHGRHGFPFDNEPLAKLSMSRLKTTIALIFLLTVAAIPAAGAGDGGPEMTERVRDTVYPGAAAVPDLFVLPDRDSVSDDLAPLYRDYSLVSEAFGTASPGNLKIRLGRQRYRTGTGYVWNPTDLFHRRNIIDAPFGTEGVDGALLSYSPFGNAELSTFYAFDPDSADGASSLAFEPEEGAYQVKVAARTEIWDLAIHYTDSRQDRTDYEGLSAGEGSADDARIPVRWQLLAAGISGELGGLGIHAEGGHAWLSLPDGDDPDSADRFARDHSRFLVGIDYTFGNKLYLVLEYFQEGQGKTSPKDYTVNDRMAYFNNEREAIGRDNVFFGAKYPITAMTSVELYHIINANDPSVMLNPWLVWSAGEDMSLSFSAQIPMGKEETSLGSAEPAAYGRIQLNF